MKIKIRARRFTLPIYLPNCLIFNRWVVGMAIRSSAGAVPPASMARLFYELEKLTAQKAPWELVHIESAAGDSVIITL